jgi:UDP-N-acetylglucosamine/UDP-N-acetyl-alpha-D-glucosaminouronate 4-epimerase
MATCLVTGVAGFIGSTIARSLLAQGDEVRGLDNFSTGKRENLAGMLDQIELHEVDLLDVDAVHNACRGVDYVFHEAAIPSVPRSVKDPLENNAANVDGTLNLLVASRDAKVKRVIYAASSAAYGDSPTLPKRENMRPDPISPYATTKLAGEYYMISFYRCYGLETVCLRYFNVFGPRQDPTSPYSGVLAKFISQMLAGERPIILGDGTQSRDFTYVDDVVAANLLARGADAAKVTGKVFNAATGRQSDLLQTFQILKKITGYQGDVKFGPERPGDVKHSLADISLAEQCLGYKPKVAFEEGLARTVEWYRTREAQPQLLS